MTLRMWIRSVRTKKKHQVNIQKFLNMLMCSGFDRFLLSAEGSSEATRLKVVQPDKTSHVLTKKRGLVKSLASSTITGIVKMLNVSDPVSKQTRYPQVRQMILQFLKIFKIIKKILLFKRFLNNLVMLTSVK